MNRNEKLYVLTKEELEAINYFIGKGYVSFMINIDEDICVQNKYGCHIPLYDVENRNPMIQALKNSPLPRCCWFNLEDLLKC